MTPYAYLPIIATTLFVVGLTALGLLLWQILRSARYTDRERRYRHTVWQSDVKRAVAIISGLLAIGMSNLIFWVNSELRLFTPVTQGVPLCMIGVVHESDKDPQLVYSTVDRHGREIFQILPIRDHAFQIRGERIRWAGFLKSLGLDDFCKVTQIVYHPEPENGIMPAPTYSIDVRSGPTELFEQLHHYAGWLPFVKTDSVRSVSYDALQEFSAHLYVESDALKLQ